MRLKWRRCYILPYDFANNIYFFAGRLHAVHHHQAQDPVLGSPPKVAIPPRQGVVPKKQPAAPAEYSPNHCSQIVPVKKI